MLRSDLIRAMVRQSPGISAHDVEKIVTLFFEEIVRTLAAGDRVEIRGFGSFSTRVLGARIGRNPRTGEDVAVSDRRKPHFKPGKHLRETIFSGETD